MRCPSCDADIPEGATVCPRCGADIAPVSVGAHWETCAIQREVGTATQRAGRRQQSYRYAVFVAYAKGPGGTYPAGHSPRVPLAPGQEAAGAAAGEAAAPERQALEDLRASLQAQGWEPIDSGPEWYRHRFRRAWDPQRQQGAPQPVGAVVAPERAGGARVRPAVPGCSLGLLWLVVLVGCACALRGRGGGRAPAPGPAPSRS